MITTELGRRPPAIQRVDLVRTSTFSPLTPAGRLGIVAQALLIFTTRVPSLRSPELCFLLGCSGKVLLRKKVTRSRRVVRVHVQRPRKKIHTLTHIATTQTGHTKKTRSRAVPGHTELKPS